ncbi:MAG TPA: efflux RND transporter periplasmic adaptor subunit [Burkholderiales bacterium]|nr:efflux RND transporter periplasmic adaptor subunit [Burkholderiales bacterium]
MPRRWIAVAVALILLAGGALYLARNGEPEQAAPAEAPQRLDFLAGDLYTVREQPLARTLPLTGTLTPLVEAAVKAKVPGQLVEVTVREGEQVTAGQVLARIDPTDLRARVAAREAEVAAARSQLELARQTLRQQQVLASKGFISKNALQNAQSGFEVAQARLRTARADLALAQEELDHAVLRAPFDGTVAARLAEPGERVAVDAPVLRLVDLSRLALQAPVPAESIGEVRVGQQVSFRVQGFGEREFAGKVERINPTTTEGSRSIPVHVAIDNPDGTLRGGLFASGSLVLERVEHALPVPATAVREDGGQAYVYVIENDAVRRRAVTLGIATRTGFVNVRAGLEAGDVVVRTNLGQLREGAQVRVVRVAAQAYP